MDVIPGVNKRIMLSSNGWIQQRLPNQGFYRAQENNAQVLSYNTNNSSTHTS